MNDTLNPYELQRLAQIEENNKRLRAIGVFNTREDLNNTLEKKEIKKREKKIYPAKKERLQRSIKAIPTYKESPCKETKFKVNMIPSKQNTNLTMEDKRLPKRLRKYTHDKKGFLVQEIGLDPSFQELLDKALNILEGFDKDGTRDEQPLTIYALTFHKVERVVAFLGRGWTTSQIDCYREWREKLNENGEVIKVRLFLFVNKFKIKVQYFTY
jgi:hypothetical protein